jgi:hypothetical protein
MVEGAATMMPMVSLPKDPAATTLSVSRPVRLAGSFTEIALLFHDVTVKDCAVLEPAGYARTWQPLHCEPKFAPLRVTVVPAVSTRGLVLASGVTEKTAAPILQRAAQE